MLTLIKNPASHLSLLLMVILFIGKSTGTRNTKEGCPKSISWEENNLKKSIPCYYDETDSGSSCYCFSGAHGITHIAERDEAAKFCSDHGMNLLSIETEEEHHRINNLMQQNPEINNYDDFWTSGRYNSKSGIFEWVEKKSGLSKPLSSYRPARCVNSGGATCQLMTFELDPSEGKECVTRDGSCLTSNCPNVSPYYFWTTRPCNFVAPWICEL